MRCYSRYNLFWRALKYSMVGPIYDVDYSMLLWMLMNKYTD